MADTASPAMPGGDDGGPAPEPEHHEEAAAAAPPASLAVPGPPVAATPTTNGADASPIGMSTSALDTSAPLGARPPS